MATYLRIGAVGASKSDIQIRGDVSERKHEGWIELASFGFGTAPQAEVETDTEEPAADADSSSVAKTGMSGSQRFRDTGFSLSKWVGQDSPKLLDWALGGKPYDLQIDCCREGGEPYMRVFVYGARVQSLKQDVQGDADATEELKVLFERIALESTGFTKEGTRKTPARAETKAERATVAARAGVVAGRPTGKSVGKRSPKSSAQVAAEHAAERFQGVENPDFVQEDRLLSIDKVGGIEFALGSFVGSEEMSGLFSFQLEVTSENLNIEAGEVIGKPVAFRIEDHGEIDAARESVAREFHGIVSEIIAGQRAVDHRDYTLIVVPWLWFLTKRTDCRIFQAKSVVEIVEDVFKKLGFKDYDKSNVRGQYSKLDYCVQYRETDFDFVSRLLEEHGIFYFFRFEKGSHKLFLADASVAHAAGAQKDVLQSTGSVEGKHVRGWTKRLSHVSGVATFRDYNHTTPGESLESTASSVVKVPKIKDYELYDYPGRYPNVADGRQRAQTRMEAEEVSHCVVSGDGNCDSFACGTKFTVKDHECAEEKGQEYVLTGVVHRAYVLPMSDLKARIYYDNEFECIPKSVTFRPARLTEKPLIRGPQTAVVVGKKGEEIDPDEFASVKVQFHWDREGKKDENSSCFVRVAQSVAGKTWGGLWLPRIGQEVIVEFLEGDPDRPLITGSLYNADNMPPYALPANKSQSVIKTRSTKDGKADNFNELRFEDKKGSELVYFHAEKNFERVVENDDTLAVGNDKSDTIEANKTISVAKNHTESIGGDMALSVEKNRTMSISKDLMEQVDGEMSLDVKKDRSTNIGAGLEVEVGKDSKLTIGGKQTTSVTKESSLEAKKIQLVAADEISFKAGSASIVMKKSGDITIQGKKITIKGSGDVVVKGSKVAMN